MTATITRTTAQVDRKPAACPDHRARKQPGCKPCLARDAWYNRQRRRALSLGTWERLTPAENVARHITDLIDNGWTGKQIAARAGVDENVVYGIKDGKRTRGVTSVTAAAILGVTGPAPGRWLVPAIGTRRRIQALGAIGYSRPALAEYLGTTKQVLEDWVQIERVTAATRDRVKAVYDQLGHIPGPSNIARSRARKFGYAPPLAWEGVDIDDPAAQPVLDAPAVENDSYDPVTVGFAVEGRLTYDQIQSSLPDLIETVRRLARSYGDHEIVQLLRWPGANDPRPDSRTRAQNSLHKFRQRHGIPGREKYEAVYAYGPRSRSRNRSKQAA